MLRLCRIGTWFSPAADVLASTAIVGIAWSGDVGRAMAASVLLYGAGMVWNDVADVDTDRVQRPERPLPSGQVSMVFAVAIGTVLLVFGLWVSPCRSYHAGIAGLVLFYDFLGKRVEWLGAMVMGLLRGLNLATGLLLVGPTVAEGAERALLLAAGCYALYIVAVTILGIFEDARSVSGRAVAAVQ